MKPFHLALVVALLPGTALAQGAANTLGISSDKPIAVNADSFSADLNADSGTYTGNVLVVQGAVKLHADKITVDAPGGKAQRMEATGHVVLDTPSGTAVGNVATYDIPKQVMRLTGNVALTRGQNIMRGTQLVVDVATGKASMTAGAGTATSGQGRVQGLFVPQQNGAAKPPSP